MAGNAVLEFTDANFDQEVLKSDKPVLVDFWAEWCMPCRMMGPLIDRLAGTFAGKVKVGKVDVQSQQELALRFNVQSIPAVMIFKNGQVVRQVVGFNGGSTERDLTAELQKLSA